MGEWFRRQWAQVNLLPVIITVTLTIVVGTITWRGDNKRLRMLTDRLDAIAQESAASAKRAEEAAGKLDTIIASEERLQAMIEAQDQADKYAEELKEEQRKRDGGDPERLKADMLAHPCESGDKYDCARQCPDLKDPNARASCWETACKLGAKWSCNNLGDMHAKGEFSGANAEQASYWFLQACRLGLRKACKR